MRSARGGLGPRRAGSATIAAAQAATNLPPGTSQPLRALTAHPTSSHRRRRDAVQAAATATPAPHCKKASLPRRSFQHKFPPGTTNHSPFISDRPGEIERSWLLSANPPLSELRYQKTHAHQVQLPQPCSTRESGMRIFPVLLSQNFC